MKNPVLCPRPGCGAAPRISPVLPYNGRDDGGTGCNPVPRRRHGPCTAKIQAVKGVKGGDFRSAAEKIRPAPLTAWIGSRRRRRLKRNGRVCVRSCGGLGAAALQQAAPVYTGALLADTTPLTLRSNLSASWFAMSEIRRRFPFWPAHAIILA